MTPGPSADLLILDLGHDLDVLSGFSENFPDGPDAVGIADEGGEDHVHVLGEIKPVETGLRTSSLR